jgi:hypothetical protein
MLSFRYNKSERPSAPYITLEIALAGRRRKPTWRRAKLDSGASLTVIPENLRKRWNIPPFRAVTVRAYNGQKSVRPILTLVNRNVAYRFYRSRIRVVYEVTTPCPPLLRGNPLVRGIRINLRKEKGNWEKHEAEAVVLKEQSPTDSNIARRASFF